MNFFQQHHKKIIGGCIFLLLVFGMFFFSSRTNNTTAAVSPQRFWQITAVDTMKYSRDAAGDKSVLSKIPLFMQEAQKLHVTHVAIATPYDEKFYPVLKAWVHEARIYHLKVWFRGNFSGWEGWFGYPKFADVNQHHALTRSFILAHPDLFENGDIFTPVPEPENGGFGDPRGSDQKTGAFNTFLVASYNNCVQSFQDIHKNVRCGFFSTNGDIAKEVLTPQTIAQIGNIVVIDHYVNSASKMDEDLTFLENKFPLAKIVLGEYGAPIPDITGNMNEKEQASFIFNLLQVLYQHRSRILGLDYWTLSGGSTSLLRGDGAENPAFESVADFYLPPQIYGRVTDTLGNPFSSLDIKNKNGQIITTTNEKGKFVMAAPLSQTISLNVTAFSYQPYTTSFIASKRNQYLPDIQLSPEFSSFFYKIRLFFKNLILL